MDTSFYSASRGMRTMQKKIDVISNNVSNVNTNGYKRKASKFRDLMYYNIRGTEGGPQNPQAGTGNRIVKTDTDVSPSDVFPTNSPFDFAICGEYGFFKVQHPVTGKIEYTRNGHLSVSMKDDRMFLVTDDGRYLLNENGNPIMAVKDEKTGNNLPNSLPAVFEFNNTDGIISTGNNCFVPTERNGQPHMVDKPKVLAGYLESSNVDIGEEMVQMVETSRAYSYVLKMVLASDEVEQTINNLR